MRRRSVDFAIAAYCLVVLGVVAAETPRLLAARAALPFPPLQFYQGWPVAVYGIYFFTAASFVVALGATRLRGARWGDAVAFGLLGVAGYQAAYGTAYALLQGSPGLLVPSPAFPVEGWGGLASWVLLEALFASLAVYRWRWAGVDRWTLVMIMSFVLAMVTWKFVLNLAYPPFETRSIVYQINTWAEVSGSLILPLAFTARRARLLLPLGRDPASS